MNEHVKLYIQRCGFADASSTCAAHLLGFVTWPAAQRLVVVPLFPFPFLGRSIEIDKQRSGAAGGPATPRSRLLEVFECSNVIRVIAPDSF